MTTCDIDIRYFPFDDQACPIQVLAHNLIGLLDFLPCLASFAFRYILRWKWLCIKLRCRLLTILSRHTIHWCQSFLSRIKLRTPVTKSWNLQNSTYLFLDAVKLTVTTNLTDVLIFVSDWSLGLLFCTDESHQFVEWGDHPRVQTEWWMGYLRHKGGVVRNYPTMLP